MLSIKKQQHFVMRILSLLFLALFAINATAQQNPSLSGTIRAQENLAATVSLLKAADSATVKTTVSGKEGNFSFDNIVPGKYRVQVTATGYLKLTSAIIEIGTDAMRLPQMQLQPISKSLAAVTVTAKRPLIEQKIDRTILNVEASITNTGSNALEVLEKAPGVTVDKDGNISLKGKEGVMVMVDGRPTQLSGADLANLLRNMNASQLDQVEIMTNPPARYDAAGNAGIINLKTKKTKTAGYNGSLNLNFTQGRFPKISEGLNFSYRQNKLAFFTNLSHNYRKSRNTLELQRNILGSGNTVENYFDQSAENIPESRSYNGKVGLDYFATKKTTFGVALSGYRSSSESKNNNETSIATAAKELTSITRAVVTNNQRWENISANLNFRTVLDTTGRELTADMDYLTYEANNNLFMMNNYFNAEGAAMQKGDSLTGTLPQHIDVYGGRIDYTHPLRKGARLEAGLKSSLVKTDNNAVYDSIQYGAVVRDRNRSNHFVYEEAVHAAYANMNRPLSKKLDAQLGLRFEHTVSKGHQRTTGQTFERQYAQLFPTAYLQYKMDKKNNLVLNYGRRIRRPNYESLNPFIRFIDRYTYSQGNPDLKPQLSHNMELTHSYNNWLSTTLNYTATNDIIQMVIEQKGQEAYAKQSNIASMHQVGLSINMNKQMRPWWTSNLYVNVHNNYYKGIVNTTPIEFSAVTYMLNGTQQFKISKNFTAEISGFYRSAALQGVMRFRPVGMVAAGFSQQLLKNKGTLRLNVRDIFYTQKRNAIAKYGNVDATFQEATDSRQVSLGFSYRFSKGKNSPQRKRTGGSANDEQNRIGID